ncbi:methyltransferase [Trichonephila inaurata madagascariensis]|uniref:Methyltransferase n=1 Tax=Trichonephila inaurata madagascariensis TaxID=2747483 RepID=A0A8X6WQX0_9ARAC|nr:methyltransferase [Trichonephila inaurata madagascariensis]
MRKPKVKCTLNVLKMTSALFAGVKHAELYAKYRLNPPESFINSIVTYLKSKITIPLKKAVDVGCGSGQSTVVLSPYFETVLGIDVSEAQIGCAKQMHTLSNVEFRVSKGETLPATSSTVDLVTFSQSLHWFNTCEIFPEVQRILKPNGVIAAYGYWIPIPKINDENKDKKIDQLINQYLHEERLGSYWDKERYIVQEHYTNISLPFKDKCRLSLVQKTKSSLADYMGYFSTWSSYQKLFKEDSEKAEQLLHEIEMNLLTILEEEKPSKEISLNLYTDFFMIMGRK